MKQDLTILKFVQKKGVGKASGKPYDFLTASVIDDDGNVFGFNVAPAVIEEHGQDELLKMRNVSVEATVEFKPKGFDCAGTILDWQ